MNSTEGDKPNKWTHPVHARGVPSRTYDSTVKGQLTDAAILRYALQGRYGSIAQANAEEIDKTKQVRKSIVKQHEKLVRNLLADLDE